MFGSKLARNIAGSSASALKKPFPSIFPAVALLALPAIGYWYYSTQSAPRPALNAQEYVSFGLKEIIPINHNTSTFRFGLPEGTNLLGLPVASCLVTKFKKGVRSDGMDDLCIRPYTPVVDENTPEVFDLVVKKYPGGPMSTHIHSLKVGDTLEMKGPIPKFKYFANEFSEVGMLAGGTGITPMLQVIEKIIKNKEDLTKVSLVFANVEERDILLKEKLDALAKDYPLKFKVHYVLEKPPTNWSQGVGYVGTKQLESLMPLPGKGKVFICGPTPMMAALCGDKAADKSQGEIGGLLKTLGYQSSDVYKF